MIIGIIVGVLSLALIGALVSLLALIPPIRRWGQRSTTARIAVVVLVGVTAFAISFGLFTRLGAEIDYIFSLIGPAPWQEMADPLRPAIIKEIWIRNLLPPPLRQPCSTTNMEVCEKADRITFSSEIRNPWGAYLGDIGICLVSSLTSSALALFFTRQKQHH